MKKLMHALAAAGLVAGCLGAAGSAFAHDDDDWYEGKGFAGIPRWEAIAIARDCGMAVIEEVEHDDGGWEIEGRHYDGHEMEIEISRFGRVEDIEYDD